MKNYQINLSATEVIALIHVEKTIDALYKISLLPGTRRYYKRLRNDVANIINPLMDDIVLKITTKKITKGE